MAEELNSRRDFIKRAGVATAVLAGSVAAVAATAEGQHRGEGSEVGNGVVTGTSTKKEILYNKTQAWNDFYQAAK
jgi:hypothetical protein